MIRAGMDAHKRSCTVSVFDNDDAEQQVLNSPRNTFVFNTTREGVQEFMEKVPENSVVVIETSTTGKVLSKMLSSKYDIHLVAPPERKPQIKTDRRDAATPRKLRKGGSRISRRAHSRHAAFGEPS